MSRDLSGRFLAGFVVVTAAVVVSGCAAKTNVVQGTVRDEKNAPVDCRVVICRHDSGHLCDHTLEATPCRFEKTDLTAEVRNGIFRIENVPPIDRKRLSYAVVVLTGTNTLSDSFFVFPDYPVPAHQAFTLPFANEGAVVNIVLRPVPPRMKKQESDAGVAAPAPHPTGAPQP